MSGAPNKNNKSYLRVILGPMFSGKTSELIKIYRQKAAAGTAVCVINHCDDKRYDSDKLSTHDRVMIPCMQTELLKNVCLRPSTLDAYHVYVINEGQFFADLYDTVRKLVQEYGKEVYVCGLDGDFKMRKFGQILDIIPLADRVDKLHAVCAQCGHDAGFTKRLSNEKEQKLIGCSNYIPVCRRCHAGDEKIERVPSKKPEST